MKINKETEALNDTTDQRDLIDIYRTFHPKTADYTFFSSAHRTFARIHHIFSNHNNMRLDMNYRKKNCKKYKHMEAKQYTTK